MGTFIENYLHFMKNCIRPPYKKLKSLKSGFIENSNFENNRDPCMVSLTVVDDEAGFVHGHRPVPIDPDLPPPGLLRGELDVDQLPFLKQVHSCGFPVKLPESGTELICYWSKSL